MPYSMLKKTIRSGPSGLPLAANISEVTPISEATRVIYPSRSKAKKNIVIVKREDIHKTHSKGEKYFKAFIIIYTPKKRHPQTHFKDLTCVADAVFLPASSTRWQFLSSFIILLLDNFVNSHMKFSRSSQKMVINVTATNFMGICEKKHKNNRKKSKIFKKNQKLHYFCSHSVVMH